MKGEGGGWVGLGWWGGRGREMSGYPRLEPRGLRHVAQMIARLRSGSYFDSPQAQLKSKTQVEKNCVSQNHT